MELACLVSTNSTNIKAVGMLRFRTELFIPLLTQFPPVRLAMQGGDPGSDMAGIPNGPQG